MKIKYDYFKKEIFTNLYTNILVILKVKNICFSKKILQKKSNIPIFQRKKDTRSYRLRNFL